MPINAQRTVVCMFDDVGLADTAVDALQKAGFAPEQIFYSGVEHNDVHTDTFWNSLIRFFTHGVTGSHDPIMQQLKELGFSDEDIVHYDDAFHHGRIIVAVKAPGREDEAFALLRAHGAHD